MMSEEAGQMLVVYDDPSDQRSLSLDDTSSTEESPDETRLSLETPNDVIPYIGQRFATHDEGYEFYSEFAKRCGFSIRRHRTEGKDGVGKGLTRRYFVCHRAGNTPVKTSNENKPQRNRKSSRCGCQAYMRISKVTELGAPEWRVTDTDKSRILMFAKTGISVQQMMRLMELEKCVEPGYLPFTEKDVRNLLQSFRKLDPEDESVDLLRMCRNIKEKDPNFKFEYTLDSDNRLENIAWSYASSIQSYEIFGDAVVFDTTHRLTAFDLPLGIWVGMNNYGMPCFFGCVISREENSRSLSWALKELGQTFTNACLSNLPVDSVVLLDMCSLPASLVSAIISSLNNAFLGFMNGKAPQTILTDQNLCLKDAIAKEMPSTKHALCIWMIVAKFPSWFNAVLGERYNEWKAEFYRLYNLESIEDFELGWRDMVNIFGLLTNRHVANLHALRNLWALPYLRSHFFAGMTAAGLSKSINAFIQRFLSAQTRLAHFVEQNYWCSGNSTIVWGKTFYVLDSSLNKQVAVAVDFKDQAAEQQTMQQNLQNISLKTGAPMESHAATVLTPYAFSKLQEQLVLAAHYASFQLDDGFHVRHHTKHVGGRKVYWDPREGIISCSCNQFEFSGILCRHALRVLSTGKLFSDPRKLLQNMVSSLITESAKSKERLDIATEQVSILLSRIRDQPVPPQVIRDFTSIYRKL
ncbi:hypothetical protein OIU84_023229 [Salix udensis]|uniref:Protein FAR1-RELATED SEQUENCE n=1 Tax=Salix udensis TaxID=889485 RepID=A0AAD6KQD8_9ROSI|nr:hypothetical protein OIU84_023229 [Salix udensis]